MKAILQRVTRASVTVGGRIVGNIKNGYLVLLGINVTDTREEAELLARKTADMRIFDDEQGNLNLSILDVAGEALVVSNFTLYADCKKGRRPSFCNAARPDEAKKLYEQYCELLRQKGVSKVETGEFGADMKVELVNDGPVTVILDTKELV